MISTRAIGLMPSLLLAVMSAAGAFAAESDVAQSLVIDNTAFAFDLYSHLSSAPGNLFFSPCSISTCLAMTYAGARGETAAQMAKTLHFNTNQTELSTAFAALEKELNEVRQAKAIELNTANGLWTQTGQPLLPDFLKTARDQCQARVSQANFATAPEPARKEINDWVGEQTKGKIKDLLPPRTINAATRLVLVNAIYFKGRWSQPFKSSQTVEDFFTVTPDKKVKAPLMHTKARFPYAELDGFQLLELPYTAGQPAPAETNQNQTLHVAIGDPLSMVVLLPTETGGLKKLENALSETSLKEWLAKAARRQVEVVFPKFKMTAQFSLAQTLVGMGMPRAFSSQADFSGMNGGHNLFVSAVIHKAYVDVNEEGTEAAAATGVAVALTAMRSPQVPVFRADHPFIFLIRENATGTVLFLGRVLDPTK